MAETPAPSAPAPTTCTVAVVMQRERAPNAWEDWRFSIAEVLVVGPRTGITDFEHYLKKHRPETAKQVIDYQTVDHPSENQLVALARKYFLKYDRMAGTPTPT